MSSSIRLSKLTTSTVTEPWSTMSYLDMLIDVVKGFSREKKEAITKMGFGNLLHFNCRTVRKPMCKWIIDHFDLEIFTLNIYKVETVVAPRHVEYLLGFEDTGVDIEERDLPDYTAWKEGFVSLGTKTTAALATDVRKLSHSDDFFKPAFTMFFIATFAAPTNSKTSKKSWLYLVDDIDMWGSCNWAKFILDNTVAAVVEFKAAESPTELGGCPLLLMALFCEYSATSNLDGLWTYATPRISDWSDAYTKLLHDHVLSFPAHYGTEDLM